jgi:hypothetical protein
MAAQKLGPWEGVYNPGYELVAYKNGDPSKPIRGVNWRSATRIATSKTLDDVTGTFDLTLKDSRARELVGPMDVVKIRLRGHNQGTADVLRGVTDYTGPNETASPTSAQQDTEISGRCTGKYLQVNSMFLPVWDPTANLPTALTFGMGDASSKLGTNVNASTPREIFGYVFDHFVVGLRNRVGLSGTPNARFWLDRKNRFEWVKASNGQSFQVPFVQFDEDTCDTALSRLAVQGFTEGWVDEVGNIVYRRPGWDLPVSWILHTPGLISDTLQDSDIGSATYAEVFPGGMPAVSSGQAQALLAGRAPIPSDYVTGLQSSGFTSVASPEFIIDVNPDGTPTAKGQANWYYQRQRKYGLRPYQITSPLLASREQAQAQAEGLLRFMLRWQKSGTITIPGEPNVRLGQTLQLVGTLRGQRISRIYYIEGVAHEYVEGDHYTTTLTLTHGRDPWDPHWTEMALPQFSASQLAEASGILNAQGSGHGSPKDSSYTTAVPTGSAKGLQSPFAKKYVATASNVDDGVDFGTQQGISSGDPLMAIGDCYLRRIDPAWYSGQPCMFFELVDKSAGYWGFYFGEQIVPRLSASPTLITSGTVVATFAASGTGIEIGWAGSSTQTARQAAGAPFARGGTSVYGMSYLGFLRAAGALGNAT